MPLTCNTSAFPFSTLAYGAAPGETAREAPPPRECRATSRIRSTIPGRAMTSCGNASSDLISAAARKRSASYVIATRSALAMRARRVSRLRLRPTLDQRVEPGDPRPVDLDRVAVPGRHSRLGHKGLCERGREWGV